MLYALLTTGSLVSDAQKRVILSAFSLAETSQVAFAVEKKLNRSDLNRVINGKLVADKRYAEVLNELVCGVHPVQVEERLAA